MKSILIVFASLTGNTEELAELIADGIRIAGLQADLKVVEQCSASELLRYEACLLGSYTWGDGELPDEFEVFIEEMRELHLDGYQAAVFGSGDKSYRLYCGGVDRLVQELNRLGLVMKLDSLKVEYSPDAEEKSLCREFGARFAHSLLGGSGTEPEADPGHQVGEAAKF